jgi:hypothetical protein
MNLAIKVNPWSIRETYIVIHYTIPPNSKLLHMIIVLKQLFKDNCVMANVIKKIVTTNQVCVSTNIKFL